MYGVDTVPCLVHSKGAVVVCMWAAPDHTHFPFRLCAIYSLLKSPDKARPLKLVVQLLQDHCLLMFNLWNERLHVLRGDC